MRRVAVLATVLALLTSVLGTTAALAVDPARPSSTAPASLDGLRIDGGVTADVARPSVLAASLRSATGIKQVVVRLTNDSVAEVAAAGANASAQQQQLQAIAAQQNAFIASAGAPVLGQAEVAINAVALSVDASRLNELASNPAVESIKPVIDYELDLTETVPYIGADTLHGAGFTGAGVTVAVLDSGVDYAHAAFGGAGTPAAYAAAYGANTGDPLNKDMPDWATIGAATGIIGGFDFVGEAWPFPSANPLLHPDPDPIGCGGKPVNPSLGPGAPTTCAGGHGTHVADIIAGDLGVAPDASVYAVKVCSAVSTSCSGVALMLAMDFALDPNGDGVTTDHVDVINMSLGSPYGQAFDDDLAQAVENATDVGVLTVASAGNSSDKPYVTGSPAAAPSALSVAQTEVPSAVLPLLEVVSPSGLGPYPAVHQEWSAELTVALQFPLFFDGSTTGKRTGCRVTAAGASDPNLPNPFDGVDLTGRIVLVDRGICNFSEKIANIALAGGEAGVIGLVAPGEPFSGAFGVCPSDACMDIPGFMVHQSTSLALKSALAAGAVTVLFDPAHGLPLIGTMVGSSSRGPAMLTNIVKPEIGAPGASISAEAGTGTGTTPFGGTSGAAPMVSGSAALLLEAFPNRSAGEIKALLMNYAETTIYNGAPAAPISAPLAAIQRIGAGEVRVDNSHAKAAAAAWDSDAPTAALNFGFVDVSDATVQLIREVTVRNYATTAQTFNIGSSFRFGDDLANGAVAISHPASIVVPPDNPATTGVVEVATFEVSLAINGAALRVWTANSGSRGADPAPLNLLEYDGFVSLTPTAGGDAADPLHLPWHVLPRLSGETTASSDEVVIDEQFTVGSDTFPSGSVTLTNAGVGPTAIDGYSLLGESPVLVPGPPGAQNPIIDLRYVGVQTFPVSADDCTSQFVLSLAVSTWERQTHANAPAAFEWDIDTTGDGAPDYAVFNLDLGGGALSDGRNAVFVDPLGPGATTAFFFTDHATNSGNTVLNICGEQLGLGPSGLGTPLSADVFAVDIYFTGQVTDVITDVRFAPLGERYFPVVGTSGFGGGDIAAGGTAILNVLDFGTAGTNPGELGVLLFTDGARAGASGVFKTGSPQANEAIAIHAVAGPPAPPPPPPPAPDQPPFTDIAGHPFQADIVWAWENGITVGCTPTLFCPNAPVTREQMASFLVRAFDLPPAIADHFTDDESSVHEADINAVFEAGIAVGCGGTRYCPTQNVLREQMASFLARAMGLPPAVADHFTDDEASVHEPDINRLFEAGVTTGCGGTLFCPTGVVTRGQMTAFLHRALT